MEEIKLMKLLEDISWNNSKNVQEEAINELVKLPEDQLQKLIQPLDKSCWENSAKIIKKIGYPRCKSILINLLEWLQDFNWPGATIISELLMEIDKNILIPYIEKALVQARDEKDYMWVSNILGLINKINIKEKDFQNKDIYKILELADILE